MSFVSLALISLATCELFIDIYTTFQSQTGSCQRDFSRTAHCHSTLALDCDIDLLVEDSEERIGRVVDLLRWEFIGVEVINLIVLLTYNIIFP